jgi:hypothetical protein
MESPQVEPEVDQAQSLFHHRLCGRLREKQPNANHWGSPERGSEYQYVIDDTREVHGGSSVEPAPASRAGGGVLQGQQAHEGLPGLLPREGQGIMIANISLCSLECNETVHVFNFYGMIPSARAHPNSHRQGGDDGQQDRHRPRQAEDGHQRDC